MLLQFVERGYPEYDPTFSYGTLNLLLPAVFQMIVVLLSHKYEVASVTGRQETILFMIREI